MSHANQGRTLRGKPPSPRQLELLCAIVAGKLPVGIAAAAGLCGMGRNQTREALCSLESRGLVVLMGHGGPRTVTDEGLRVAAESRAA